MSVTAAGIGDVEQLGDPYRTNVLAMTTTIAERLPYLGRIAMRRLDNAADAEDAVQDAFLAAWKYLGQFKGQAQMSTWLTAIVMNASRTIIRRRGQARLLPIDGQEERENNVSFSELCRIADPTQKLSFGTQNMSAGCITYLPIYPPAYRSSSKCGASRG